MLAEITTNDVVFYIAVTVVGLLIAWVGFLSRKTINGIGTDIGEMKGSVHTLETVVGEGFVKVNGELKNIRRDVHDVKDKQSKDSGKINKNRDVLIHKGFLKPEGAEG